MAVDEETWLTTQERQKVLNCLDKVPVADCHREFDGVEVCAATKATSQVGATIDRRIGLIANRTDELELAMALLAWPAGLPNAPVDGNFVAQSPQQVCIEAFSGGSVREWVVVCQGELLS